MEQSDKHSSRIDEELKDKNSSYLGASPVDARVDERFRDEGIGPRPGQASAANLGPGREAGTSEGLSAEEVDRRAELATYLQGNVFPADRSALLESVRETQAPQPVINLVERLPEGETFENTQQVWEAASS